MCTAVDLPFVIHCRPNDAIYKSHYVYLFYICTNVHAHVTVKIFIRKKLIGVIL